MSRPQTIDVTFRWPSSVVEELVWTFTWIPDMTPPIIEVCPEIQRSLERDVFRNEPKKICIDCARDIIVAYCDGTTQRVIGRACELHARNPDPDIIKYNPNGDTSVQDAWLIPTTERKHLAGCIFARHPNYVVQGNHSLVGCIYFKRCDGKYRNVFMKRLLLGNGD